MWVCSYNEGILVRYSHNRKYSAEVRGKVTNVEKKITKYEWHKKKKNVGKKETIKSKLPCFDSA